MHIYQKHILDLLRKSKKLRYSELQPFGVESSHFKYHLDQLVGDGLVTRLERGVYTLTAKGKMAVDRMSEHRVNPNETPKVITYILLQRDGKYYLYRKDKEPFLGALNMISGKMHINEHSRDAAEREVREKVGLQAINVEHRLVAEVQIRESDQLISHFIAYVFTAEFEGESPKLEAFTPEDLMECKDVAADLPLLLRAIDTRKKFIAIDCAYTA